MKKPEICIMTGYGINCDYETADAFRLAGGKAERVHINDLVLGVKELERYHILGDPGGFSDGDHIKSGTVLSNRMKYKLGEQIQKFINDGKLILGICNGDQMLQRYGLIPAAGGSYGVQTTSLMFNDSGKFECRWVHIKNVSGGKCIFAKNIEEMYIPVAHGEGKFVVDSEETLQRLYDDNLIVFKYVDSEGNPANGRYPENPNGSVDDIAAISDPFGLILGMMPHPERICRLITHPQYQRIKRECRERGIPVPEEGDGLKIFRNAVDYARKNLI